MKKLGVIIILFFAVTQVSKAQFKDNAIKLNLFGLAGNQFQLSYERALSEKFSGQLSVGMMTGKADASFGDEPFWEAQRTGFIVIPEVRYYFDESLKGFYTGAFFRYRQATWEVSDTYNDDIDWSFESTRTAVGGGAIVGCQWVLTHGLHLDIFAGPQFKSVNTETKYSDGVSEDDQPGSVKLTGLDKDGVGLRLGVNIGYAF